MIYDRSKLGVQPMTPAPTWYDSKIGSNVRFECKLPEILRAYLKE